MDGKNGTRSALTAAAPGPATFSWTAFPSMEAATTNYRCRRTPKAWRKFRIIANDFSAQYGHGQGVIQMNTKSGTNQFHGQGNYNLRNEALMANSRANKASWAATTPLGIQRPPFKVNELGGAVGGPILKDKLFFFASYHYLQFQPGR